MDILLNSQRLNTILSGSVFIIVTIILILTGILANLEFFGISGGIGLFLIGLMFFLLNIRQGAKEEIK